MGLCKNIKHPFEGKCWKYVLGLKRIGWRDVLTEICNYSMYHKTWENFSLYAHSLLQNQHRRQYKISYSYRKEVF